MASLYKGHCTMKQESQKEKTDTSGFRLEHHVFPIHTAGVTVKQEPPEDVCGPIRSSTPVKDDQTVRVQAPGSLQPPAAPATRFMRPWEVSPVKPDNTPACNTPSYTSTNPSFEHPETVPQAQENSRFQNTTGRLEEDVHREMMNTHSRLITELGRAVVESPNNVNCLRMLTASYESTVHNLETIRAQVLQTRLHDGSSQRHIHLFYDKERLKVANSTLRTLESYISTLSSWSATTTPPGYLRNPSTPCHTRKHSTPKSTGSASTGESSQGESFSGSGNSSTSDFSVFSMPLDRSRESSSSDVSPTAGPAYMPLDSPVSKRHMRRNAVNRRSQLNPETVARMEAWYRQNFDHPYPDRKTVEHFALTGRISAQQVKKWMANKRVRSFNTLSFNGSIHPKKMQRLKLELSPPISHAHLSPMAIHSMASSFSPFGQVLSDISASLSSRGADPTEILNEWYQAHKDYPYPSELEREQLGLASHMTRDQVRQWMSNRRQGEQDRSTATAAQKTSSHISQLTRRLQSM